MYYNPRMDFKDVFFTPFYLLILYLLVWQLQKKVCSPENKRFYYTAFFIKIFGSTAFAFIYQFYYGGGDTFNFYQGAYQIWFALLDNPYNVIGILMLKAREFNNPYSYYTQPLMFFRNSEEWIVVKIATVISLFCFNTYLVISFCFATFAFFGLWLLFETFANLYPQLRKRIWLAVFITPSAVFWGSGLMKDTLTLGATGFLAWALFSIFYYKRQNLVVYGLLYISVWLLYYVKPYILFTFLPAGFLWIYLRFQEKIKNKALKGVGILMLILIFIASFAYIATLPLIQDLGEVVGGFHTDHGRLAGGASYTLGEIDYSIAGFLQKMPLAIYYALFKPYPWEARNPVMFVSAVESFVLLNIVVILLFKQRFFKPFYNLLANPDLIMCFAFTILLGFAVGFTSFNYGMLSRVKIPFMPFFAILLVILYDGKQTQPASKQNVKTKKPMSLAEIRQKILAIQQKSL